MVTSSLQMPPGIASKITWVPSWVLLCYGVIYSRWGRRRWDEVRQTGVQILTSFTWERSWAVSHATCQRKYGYKAITLSEYMFRKGPGLEELLQVGMEGYQKSRLGSAHDKNSMKSFWSPLEQIEWNSRVRNEEESSRGKLEHHLLSLCLALLTAPSVTCTSITFTQGGCESTYVEVMKCISAWYLSIAGW